MTTTPEQTPLTGAQTIDRALESVKAGEHLRPFPASIKWEDLVRVTEQEPLLLRNIAGLQQRLGHGPMTLTELLQWQRDHWAMAV